MRSSGVPLGAGRPKSRAMLVSVVVSVGFSIWFAMVRRTALTVSRGNGVNTSVFAVLRFGAECCETLQMA